MNQNQRISLVICIVVLFVAAITGFKYGKSVWLARDEQRNMDVREALVRLAIESREWNDIWFVDFGENTDPPASFMERLADLPDSIKNVSEAGEGSYGSIIEPATGKPAYIVSVRIIRWIDSETVKVEYSAFHSSVAAGGAKGVMSLVNGKWQLETLEGWVS